MVAVCRTRYDRPILKDTSSIIKLQPLHVPIGIVPAVQTHCHALVHHCNHNPMFPQLLLASCSLSLSKFKCTWHGNKLYTLPLQCLYCNLEKLSHALYVHAAMISLRLCDLRIPESVACECSVWTWQRGIYQHYPTSTQTYDRHTEPHQSTDRRSVASYPGLLRLGTRLTEAQLKETIFCLHKITCSHACTIDAQYQ